MEIKMGYSLKLDVFGGLQEWIQTVGLGGLQEWIQTVGLGGLQEWIQTVGLEIRWWHIAGISEVWVY